MSQTSHVVLFHAVGKPLEHHQSNQPALQAGEVIVGSRSVRSAAVIFIPIRADEPGRRRAFSGMRSSDESRIGVTPRRRWMFTAGHSNVGNG